MSMFRDNEVIAFLEEAIHSGNATENEEEMYIDYKWLGKIDKNKHKNTYRKLLRKMRHFYENGFQ